MQWRGRNQRGIEQCHLWPRIHLSHFLPHLHLSSVQVITNETWDSFTGNDKQMNFNIVTVKNLNGSNSNNTIYCQRLYTNIVDFTRTTSIASFNANNLHERFIWMVWHVYFVVGGSVTIVEAAIVVVIKHLPVDGRNWILCRARKQVLGDGVTVYVILGRNFEL
jgi:hypothetical protein